MSNPDKSASDALAEAAKKVVDFVWNNCDEEELLVLADAIRGPLLAYDAEADVREAERVVIEEAMRCYILDSWGEGPDLHNACFDLHAAREQKGKG